MSEETKGIKQKVFEIRNTIGKLKKNASNPFYNSQYLELNELLDEVQPLVETNRILLTQPIKDGTVFSILECLDTGEVMDSGIDLPQISDPQKIGSAITYYRRYTLKSLLAISEEDDDANKASEAKEEEEKEWLNATNRDGSINKTGIATAKKLINGETDWKTIYSKVKVSKKDKSAIDARVKEMGSDDDIPF
jgi:hypothetical protein